jgi:dipeptidyl-peptidase-4
MRRPPLLLAVSLLASSPSFALEAKGAAAELTLDRIFSDPPLDGRAPTGLMLSPGGAFVSYLKPNEADSEVLDLWGQRLPDGKPALLVATADLLGGKAQKLTEQEKMALERKRITKRGITSYLWCGKDDARLIFPLSGDLYVAELGDPARNGGKPVTRRLTTDEDVPEMDPVCSPDGSRISVVKKGDVVVIDTKSGKAKRLTSGASETRTFGLAEFIAQEEMGREAGKWWSPDGKQLLAFEVDESGVARKTRAQIFADRTEMFEQRYPAAGEKNAVVTAWLIDVATGKKVKLLTPSEDGYLARGGFFGDGKAWVQWLSRDQKRLVLFESNASGVLRKVVEETDDTWVELHDDLASTKDPQKLLWSTEKSGRKQLVVVDRKTGAQTPLTSEPEPVDGLLGVDEDKGVVFFAGYRDRGRQLQVFSIPLAGGASTQLTKEPGWHNAVFDDAGHFFVDKRSDFGRPWRTSIADATGKEVVVLDDNPADELRSFPRSQPQWLDLQAADGQTLNGLLLPPTTMEKGRKYPVITYVYGFPSTSIVRRSWMRQDPVFTSWTEHGYGVFVVDPRGSSGRDRAFSHAHAAGFEIEVGDVFGAVLQMKEKAPWVDGDRIGVFGWSGGGTLAARSVLDDKSPFAAAVAVAPGTDWTLYDTCYTERYLGMPVVDGKPNEKYTSSHLPSRAKLLSRPLLLMHGTADDNVLFEHTLRLVEALQKEGKLFELMIYPGKAHGIAGKTAQLHVYKTITAFFDRQLKR